MENHIITKAYEFTFYEDYFVFKQLVHKKEELKIKYIDIIEFDRTSYSFAFYAASTVFKCKIKNYGDWYLDFSWLRKNEWPLLGKAIEQIIEKRTDFKMKEYEATLPKKEGVICPHCSCVLKPNAKFCHQCGTKIGNAIKAKFCTQCGARIEPGEIFCSECGTKIDN